jgi:hypothetical protein
MRRAHIVRMIRPIQLALALTPLVALVLPSAVTQAASASIARGDIRTGEGDSMFTLHAEHALSSLDNATGFRCAR